LLHQLMRYDKSYIFNSLLDVTTHHAIVNIDDFGYIFI